MAILYGTQSNGETLPVLVDQFGNLLAKGIEGPPGPPGVGELPSDPYEGAILGWKNGQLAWVTQAVIVPGGTFGPYTYIADEHRLEVPQDASELISNGSLFMSDQFGKRVETVLATDYITNVTFYRGFVLTFPTNKNFSAFAIGDVVGEQAGTANREVGTAAEYYENFVSNWYDKGKAFDGQLNTYARAEMNASSSACYFVYDFKGAYETVAATETVLVRLPYNSTSNPSTINFSAGSAALENMDPPPGGSGVWLGKDVSDFILTGTTSLKGIAATVSISQGRTIELGSVVIIDKATRAIRKIVDQSAIFPVVIEAIDPAVPSITTDIGSFTGTDGSGVPGGQEFLTKKLSGEGTVEIGTNGNIILKEDNGEWPNDFYVTSSATEVAAYAQRQLNRQARQEERQQNETPLR
jgi:hypothetical protein